MTAAPATVGITRRISIAAMVRFAADAAFTLIKIPTILYLTGDTANSERLLFLCDLHELLLLKTLLITTRVDIRNLDANYGVDPWQL